MTVQLAALQDFWIPIAPYLSLRNDEEYEAAIERLNSLVDEVGTNESHPLYGLLDTLGTLVHNYERQQQSFPSATGAGVLQYLMEEHGLAAGDLTEVGPPEAVERILAGEQELNTSQVRALAQRFHVSPAAFI